MLPTHSDCLLLMYLLILRTKIFQYKVENLKKLWKLEELVFYSITKHKEIYLMEVQVLKLCSQRGLPY